MQKWKDKRDVLTISTKHNASFKEVKSKNGKLVNKPSTIVDYNCNMLGVDRSDQMISYYSSPRKTLRWYIKLFFHVMDISIWNACFLHNRTHSSKMNYLEFRNDLAKKLLNADNIINVLPFNNKTSETKHFPKKLDKRIRCRVCSTKKLRKETFYSCGICKTNNGLPIGLCVDECFQIFHEK